LYISGSTSEQRSAIKERVAECVVDGTVVLPTREKPKRAKAKAGGETPGTAKKWARRAEERIGAVGAHREQLPVPRQRSTI
jgi:hypothetical protein